MCQPPNIRSERASTSSTCFLLFAFSAEPQHGVGEVRCAGKENSTVHTWQSFRSMLLFQLPTFLLLSVRQGRQHNDPLHDQQSWHLKIDCGKAQTRDRPKADGFLSTRIGALCAGQAHDRPPIRARCPHTKGYQSGASTRHQRLTSANHSKINRPSI